MSVSKRNVLDALNTLNITEDIVIGDVVVTPEDIKDYIDKTIAQLENKAIKAAEKAQERKEAGDELRARIYAVLDDSPKTVVDIVEALNDEDVTSAKVVSRLAQLVKLGQVSRFDAKVGDRKLKVYSIATSSTDTESID